MRGFGFCCVHCQQPLAIAHHGLCSRCNQQIRRFAYCGHCGKELTRDALRCGHWLQHKASWDRMVIVGHYVDPLSCLIHRFKFQHAFFLDRTLARLLLLALYHARRTHGLIWPEVLLPVPLHRLRHWQRGYNQSALIANYLAHWLKIPCDHDFLQRIKHTHTQRGLSATERRKNLRHAFRLHPKSQTHRYQSVALIDDVITTGATLNELALLLRKAGVEHIQVWGLAKT
ncbi:comF family protein [Pasteurella multocida]|uniref:ComF family protein n=1 Tax=Pasteurella multocida TaxID=747 RepID=UPI0008F1F4E8|nr:ComF family protein [Pasteurella multocida]SFP50832.1 comF family protein [Pasteurella multocida]VEE37128.1 competence protein F [Pasteurella multocida subsp. gallicida]